MGPEPMRRIFLIEVSLGMSRRSEKNLVKRQKVARCSRVGGRAQRAFQFLRDETGELHRGGEAADLFNLRIWLPNVRAPMRRSQSADAALITIKAHLPDEWPLRHGRR